MLIVQFFSRPHPQNRACLTAAGAAIALMLAVVAGATAAPVALEGTYWRLVQMHGEVIASTGDVSPPHIALHRDTNRIAGFGGCNRFFGQYSTSGQEISLQPLGGSRASCPDTDALERAFIGALASVEHYALVGGQLTLSTGGRQILVFDAVADQ